ncbi:hypothetical protein [Campylobacter hyointestinalis]|uniref:hypothetical protein n=1 Tax=Campylobacter hyointestinalis TaxID=198 RepID=UPI000DCF2DAC|nr:hypothetical protein [Campylobacter hyointestinalis]RAZ55094.1 hypothetical protein CHL10074_05720 [Campylobacter hyointestinalis subsp. lawsonii]RAZ65434.1 hypothetical protein CHL9767_00755 [Campylobacter hyointestinalis subsp. lawsonii]
MGLVSAAMQYQKISLWCPICWSLKPLKKAFINGFSAGDCFKFLQQNPYGFLDNSSESSGHMGEAKESMAKATLTRGALGVPLGR